jgi:hypothetical protein
MPPKKKLNLEEARRLEQERLDQYKAEKEARLRGKIAPSATPAPPTTSLTPRERSRSASPEKPVKSPSPAKGRSTRSKTPVRTPVRVKEEAPSPLPDKTSNTVISNSTGKGVGGRGKKTRTTTQQTTTVVQSVETPRGDSHGSSNDDDDNDLEDEEDISKIAIPTDVGSSASKLTRRAVDRTRKPVNPLPSPAVQPPAVNQRVPVVAVRRPQDDPRPSKPVERGDKGNSKAVGEWIDAVPTSLVAVIFLVFTIAYLASQSLNFRTLFFSDPPVPFCDETYSHDVNVCIPCPENPRGICHDGLLQGCQEKQFVVSRDGRRCVTDENFDRLVRDMTNVFVHHLKEQHGMYLCQDSLFSPSVDTRGSSRNELQRLVQGMNRFETDSKYRVSDILEGAFAALSFEPDLVLRGGNTFEANESAVIIPISCIIGRFITRNVYIIIGAIALMGLVLYLKWKAVKAKDYEAVVNGYVDDILCQLQERSKSSNAEDTKVALETLQNSLGLHSNQALWDDVAAAVSKDSAVRRCPKKVGGASKLSWQYVQGLK